MDTIYGKYIKRIIDFVLAFLAIVLLSWLLIIIAIIVKATGDGSIVFKQKRIGKDGHFFQIYKFETMSKDTPSELSTDQICVSDIKYTRIGEFLRKTSLNELPQLFNILKGDMAVIGPRPALWNQYELIAAREANCVNSVRPGLTGWAQVNGRDLIDGKTKVMFDTEYVQNMSFIFDCKCFFRTFKTIASFTGVVEGGQEEISAKDGEENTKRKQQSDKEKATGTLL